MNDEKEKKCNLQKRFRKKDSTASQTKDYYYYYYLYLSAQPLPFKSGVFLFLTNDTSSNFEEQCLTKYEQVLKVFYILSLTANSKQK